MDNFIFGVLVGLGVAIGIAAWLCRWMLREIRSIADEQEREIRGGTNPHPALSHPMGEGFTRGRRS